MKIKTLCFGALAIGATTAEAGKADLVDQHHDEFSEPEELLSAVCGFEIIVSVDVRGTLRVWNDGRYH